MKSKDILKALATKEDVVPTAALQAALEQRDEIAPLLLAETALLLRQFKEALDKAETDRQYVSACKKLTKTRSPLFYGFLLAAEWKQTEAFPFYAQLLTWSWSGTPNLLSEIVFHDLGARIMAEIYNGDPKPLFGLLLDETADESIRYWQWRTVILLGVRGTFSLEMLRRFLTHAFDDLEHEPDLHVWVGWEEVIIYFGLEDLIPLVEKAHAAQFIRDRTIEDFCADYAYARAHPEQPLKGESIVPFRGLFEEAELAAELRAES